ALDDVDDVPADATDPPSGTLRKFVGNAIQAWLYQVRKLESSDEVGGISPEGLGYGEISLRGISFLLLGLHTTHADKPAVYGPPSCAGCSTIVPGADWPTGRTRSPRRTTARVFRCP